MAANRRSRLWRRTIARKNLFLVEDAHESGVHVQTIRRWLPARNPEVLDATADPFAPHAFELLDDVPQQTDTLPGPRRERPISVRPLKPGELDAGGRSFLAATAAIDRVSCLLSTVMIVDLCFSCIFVYSLFRSSSPDSTETSQLAVVTAWLPAIFGLVVFIVLGGWMASRWFSRQES
jgi:hypothetical protein